ncbi:hypothetical protein Tco_0870132 [Tanacetum coccineum]
MGWTPNVLLHTSRHSDLVVAVRMCARYQAKPTKKHLEANQNVSFGNKKEPLRTVVSLVPRRTMLLSLKAYADAGSCGLSDSTRFSFEERLSSERHTIPYQRGAIGKCNRVLERQKKLRNQIFRALTASADVPSSVTETTDTTSTPPPPLLQKLQSSESY